MKRLQIVTISAFAVVAATLLAIFGLPPPLSSGSPKNPCSDVGSTFFAGISDIAYQDPRERYENSELVVVGRVTESVSRCDGPMIMTYMNVDVEESLKNPQNVGSLIAKSFGGTIGDFSIAKEDAPIFNKGDRTFLYLYKESASDDAYMVNPFSSALVYNDRPDESISGKEILETFRLQVANSSNFGNTVELERSSSRVLILELESYFGYDLPTNVTLASFTFYIKSTQDSFNTINITALSDLGLAVEPKHVVIRPQVNGTAQVQFQISASDSATLGSYELIIQAADEDRYWHLAGGVPHAIVRVNVTGDPDPIQHSNMQPAGISLSIEPYGRREFYQDENAGLPANLTISNASAFRKEATISWPSIGPNCVITKPGIISSDNEVVFDYYQSVGIDGNMSQFRYDESVNIRNLELPPALFGRAFGCEWNQTNLDGEKVEPGTYQVILTIPVVIEERGQKEIFSLTSEPDSFTIIEGKPAPQIHDLIFEYNVSRTHLLTDEPYSFSLFLINNGNNTESFTLDHNSEEGPCYWRHTAKLEHPDHILPPGGRINLAQENNIGSAPKIPGMYPHTPYLMLSIDEPARVECQRVEANTVTLNVTARVYEGVKLVVTTNKDVYKRNETIVIDLYIDNNNYKPFKLQEIVPSITIKNASTGKSVYGTAWFADYSEYPTVWPYSRYGLTSTVPLSWDQTVYLEDGSIKQAESGEYSILATFTSPYLKSEEHSILIED